jgi:hypothetical protein
VHQSQPSIPFVDGGVTPHSNPAFALFLMATLKAYKICWPTGPENLTIVSIGTGTHRRKASAAAPTSPIMLAYDALTSLMDNAQVQVLTLMQWLGQALTPWTINREIGTLEDDHIPGGPLFRFVRYDVRLEAEWLERNFDGELSAQAILNLRDMARSQNIPLAFEIGRQAARRQVKPEHFGLSARIEADAPGRPARDEKSG